MFGETMHKPFLLAALEQAWLGRGMCAPNPSVGAVAVQYGKIIAQSFHHGAGSAHAEARLLAQLPNNCKDVTIYVTLEPCNHWGKTPPCVNAIIDSGVSSVVYAYSDPNPLVSVNNTPALLRAHDISVLHYPIPEVDQFYESYRYWTRTRKPWVTVKLAQTFDGKIAGDMGKTALISNSQCFEFTHQHRLHSDMILTTARTINQDDPLLNVRLPDYECAKPLAIIDARLTANEQARIFTSARHCHIYHDKQYTPSHARDKCSFYPISSQSKQLNLHDVIEHIGQLGCHDLWVEAGATLFDALHKHHLVNRTYVYLAPKLLGESAIPAYHRQNVFEQAGSIAWLPMGDNMIAQFDWQEDACSQDL
jgi:diaminohydroxyphosphoribosylaminopyrimidine deaminase/5-amino-6-(5-phosphoribosylamino)uracil reductase